jgi:hypothetical protein
MINENMGLHFQINICVVPRYLSFCSKAHYARPHGALDGSLYHVWFITENFNHSGIKWSRIGIDLYLAQISYALFGHRYLEAWNWIEFNTKWAIVLKINSNTTSAVWLYILLHSISRRNHETLVNSNYIFWMSIKLNSCIFFSTALAVATPQSLFLPISSRPVKRNTI